MFICIFGLFFLFIENIFYLILIRPTDTWLKCSLRELFLFLKCFIHRNYCIQLL